MAKSNSSISSREKIAVLMVALGNDIAAEVYKKLDDTTIEAFPRKILLKLALIKSRSEALTSSGIANL